jgi:hypothetical protein
MLSAKQGGNMTDAERITFYREKRDKALKTISDINDRGVQFFEAQGNEDMRDVTVARLFENRRDVAMYDKLIELWKSANA